MSRIYFHTPTETAELLGSEHAHAGLFSENLGFGVLEDMCDEDELGALVGLPRRHPMLRVSLRYADKPLLEHNGVRITAWPLLLNTALIVGNDAVKLLTRISAQCEIHGWIAGEDRDWMADIIEDGRRLGIFRVRQGWEEVVAMLRRNDREPVVLSYSVTDEFPNYPSSTWEPPIGLEDDEIYEAYDQITAEQKWAHGIAWLKEHPERLLQFRPDDWAEVRLGHGLSAFDLATILRERRDEREAL